MKQVAQDPEAGADSGRGRPGFTFVLDTDYLCAPKVGGALMRVLTILLLALSLPDSKIQQPEEKLVYFGFEKHDETAEDVLRLSLIWGIPPLCADWRPTLRPEDADYQVLFGVDNVTLINRWGRVLYTGSAGPLYLPHVKPDGPGVNICKFTGE
jgi:hypothetical protein